MKLTRLSRALPLALLSAATFTVVGCASSKMASTPQPASAAQTPTKEYEFHDMSTGKGFFGRPLPTTAQAQPAAQP